MSEYDTTRANLKAILNLETADKLDKAFPRFQKDNWLCDNINKRAQADRINNDNLNYVVNVLDNIVFTEYVVDPISLSPIYRMFNESKATFFKNNYNVIREHVNKLAAIEPIIFSAGIVESENKNSRSNNEYYSPVSYNDNSYAEFLFKTFKNANSNNNNNNNNYTPIKDIVDKFESHFASIKNDGLDVKRLVDNGYCNILQYIQENAVDKSAFGNVMDSVKVVMENLKRDGFDVYRKESLATVRDFVKNNNIGNLLKFTEKFDKNVLILNLNLRLEKN